MKSVIASKISISDDCLVHAREQARVFQSDRSVAGDGMEELSSELVVRFPRLRDRARRGIGGGAF